MLLECSDQLLSYLSLAEIKMLVPGKTERKTDLLLSESTLSPRLVSNHQRSDPGEQGR